ncbi:MAG: methyltransferase domain-containing protein [Candidatus Eremiobacteraeota bacterium]|nr:methyltransferase domain-containing protein [Candidatus Eremiobacteraeota bacterium]
MKPDKTKLQITILITALLFTVLLVFLFHRKQDIIPGWKIPGVVNDKGGKPATPSGDKLKTWTDTKVVPDGEFPLLKPLDPKKYKNLSKDELQIFNITAKSLLNENRARGRNNPYVLLDILDLKEGDNIGDIGCGPGYYTFILAYRVGKKVKDPATGKTVVKPVGKNGGLVYAVDFYPPMITYVKFMREHLAKERKVDFQNIKFICNEADGLVYDIPADTLDFAFLSEMHIYNHIPDNPHQFVTQEQRKNKEYYFNMLRDRSEDFTKSIHNALKPGGLLFITETCEVNKPNQSILYKDDVIKLLESTGLFKFEKTDDSFMGAYLLFMKKITGEKEKSK